MSFLVFCSCIQAIKKHIHKNAQLKSVEFAQPTKNQDELVNKNPHLIEAVLKQEIEYSFAIDIIWD